MNKEQIKALALANGFSLKQQPEGNEDLNPYVYQFAAALAAQAVLDAIDAHKNNVMTFGFDSAIRITDLIKYANKIRQGEV